MASRGWMPKPGDRVRVTGQCHSSLLGREVTVDRIEWEEDGSPSVIIRFDRDGRTLLTTARPHNLKPVE